MTRQDYITPDDYGIMLGKKSERLVVSKKGKVIKELPFLFLRSITIPEKGTAISTDLIQKCCEHGIQINFLDYQNTPIAKLTSPQLTMTIEILKGQFNSLNNKNGLILAQKIIDNKIKNQKRLLKYFNKYQESPVIEDYTSKIDNCLKSLKEMPLESLDINHPSLLGIEGAASSFYWQAVKEIIGNKANFTGRKTRGAKDLTNAMLNYGYAIIYTRIWGMVMLSGMEPFMGYIHKDRSGKPSLVLDIQEMYRLIPEHAVITYINNSKKELPQEMTDDIKKEIANKVVEKLSEYHQYKGKNFPMESIMQKTIRNISMFLRDKAELDLYTYPLR